MRDRRRLCRLFYARKGMEAEPEAPQRSEDKKSVAPYGVTIPHPARPVFYGLPATRKPDGRRQKEGKASRKRVPRLRQ